MAAAEKTTDHETIREWVEERGGHPAAVRGTGTGDDPGILRIEFPGYSGEQTLQPLDWNTFFEWFDNNELAFLYTPDEKSRFNKLVKRDESANDDGTTSGGRAANRDEDDDEEDDDDEDDDEDDDDDDEDEDETEDVDEERSQR
jgi:hypothetical protein